MRARDAVLTWTPNTPDMPKEIRGGIRISPFPLRGQGLRHLITRGAGDGDWDNASQDILEKAIFTEFNAIVVRDGIDPKRAHLEFLKIDEYRANISPDIPRI